MTSFEVGVNSMAVNGKRRGGKLPDLSKRPKRQQVIPYPKMIEERYALLVRRLVNTLLGDVDTYLVSELPHLKDYWQAALDVTPVQRLDAFDDDLDRLLAGILVRFGDRVDRTKLDINDVGRSVDRQNQTETAAAVKRALGVDLLGTQTDLPAQVNDWTSSNVSLIKKMGDDNMGRIKQIVLDGFRNGYTPNTIAMGIQDAFKSTEDRSTLMATGLSVEGRADLLARDQLGKLNGQISKSRQQKLGLRRYMWDTSRDERVRESHRVLQGRVFFWNESDGEVAPEGAPGIPIKCRCIAVPIFDDIMSGDE